MKHGKKPTVAQRGLIRAAHSDPAMWLVERDTPAELILRHRYFDQKKVIKKGGEKDG